MQRGRPALGRVAERKAGEGAEVKLLDLFCSAGGAGEGYARAGFDVTGVDIVKQPHNPHRFILADAIEYVREHGHEYDVIHASPPCQAHTALKTMPNAKKHVDLIPATRAALIATGKPYIIENVPGAPLLNPHTLCGTMFGLGVGDAELRRHRLFESNVMLSIPLACRHYERDRVIGVYGGHGRDRRRIRGGTQQFSTAERAIAMGIDWMTGAELSQAIPPDYAEFIGRELIRRLMK